MQPQTDASPAGPSPPKKRKVSGHTCSRSGAPPAPPRRTEQLILKRGYTRVLEAWADIRERHESAPLSGAVQAGPGHTRALRLDEDDIIDMRPAEPVYYRYRGVLDNRRVSYAIGKSRALVDPVHAAMLAAAGDPRQYPGGQADGQAPDGDSEDLEESEDDACDDESSSDEMAEWRLPDPVASGFRRQQKRREIDVKELAEFMAAEALRRAQDPPGCGPDDDLEPESEPEPEPAPAPKPVVVPRLVDVQVSDDELSLQPVAITPRARSPKKKCATPFATPTGRREQTAGPSTTKAVRRSIQTISLVDDSDDELEMMRSSPLSKGKQRAATAPIRKGPSPARKITRRPSPPSGMRFALQSPTPAPESTLSAIACAPSSPAPLSSAAPPSPPPSAQRTPSPRKQTTSFAVLVPFRTRSRPTDVVAEPESELELEPEPQPDLEDSDVIVADSEDEQPSPMALGEGKRRATGLQTPPDSRGYAPRAPCPPSPVFAQPTTSYVAPPSPGIPERSQPRLRISPPPSKSLSLLARGDSPFVLTSPGTRYSRTFSPWLKKATDSSPAAKLATTSPTRLSKSTLATSSPRKPFSDIPSPSSQRKADAARIKREEEEREAARLENLALEEWEHLGRLSPELGDRAQSAQSEDDDPLWFSPTKNEDASPPVMASSPTRRRRRSSKRVVVLPSVGSDDELMLV